LLENDAETTASHVTFKCATNIEFVLKNLHYGGWFIFRRRKKMVVGPAGG